MAGRVQDAKLDGPDLHRGGLLEDEIGFRGGRRVRQVVPRLPGHFLEAVRIRLVDSDLRTHLLGDWGVVGDVVGMAVGVDEELEREPASCEAGQDFGGAERGIDEQSLLRIPVVHEVDVVVQRGDYERLDVHRPQDTGRPP